MVGSKIFRRAAADYSAEGTMTVEGTANRTFLLLLITVVAASLTWKMFFAGNEMANTLMYVGIFGGLIAAIFTSFSPKWAYISAPIYAVLEGLFLGGISAIFEASIGGIVMQAVGLTFGVFFVMLFLYRSRTIQATPKFTRGVIAATGGIVLFYLFSFVLSLFGVNIGFLHDGGLLSIGISLAIVVVAALNLILDFNMIEEGASYGAPKYMEWYGAFGLLVTLVWLYIEILRLVSYLSRD